MSQENVEIVKRGYAALQAEAIATSGSSTSIRTWCGTPRASDLAAAASITATRGRAVLPRLACEPWRELRVRDQRVHRCRGSVVVVVPPTRHGAGRAGFRSSATSLASTRCGTAKVVGRTAYESTRGGPRSRRAVGVGDVGGERGARAPRLEDAFNRGDRDAWR